jgi:hypothetical protein
MYNGMSGNQIEADIYMGPTYYMRLKHMVKDKINYRARGPNTNLTRQPVQGRANDGGLRIGEMERDGVLAHGMSYFLNESFMVRGESKDYYIAICNKSGAIAIYNEAKNLFLSPAVDGPIKFNLNPDGTQSIMNVSRFGRSFSILKVPYAFKLLIQELQVMNVQMRIITEENVDQLLSMSYSDNINKLLQSDKPAADLIKETTFNIKRTLAIKPTNEVPHYDGDVMPEPVNLDTSSIDGNNPESPQYAPYSPAYNSESPQYAPYSPAYNSESPTIAPVSPTYNSKSIPTIAPVSPAYNSESMPTIAPASPAYNQESHTSSVKPEIIINPNILDVPEEAKEETKEEVKEDKSSEIVSDVTSSSETRKIIL